MLDTANRSDSKVPSCGNQPAHIRLTRVDTTRSTPSSASSGQRKAAATTSPRSPLFPAHLTNPATYQGLNGLTANWITRYGALTRARVSHWLTKMRSSSRVDPGEM